MWDSYLTAKKCVRQFDICEMIGKYIRCIPAGILCADTSAKIGIRTQSDTDPEKCKGVTRRGVRKKIWPRPLKISSRVHEWGNFGIISIFTLQPFATG